MSTEVLTVLIVVPTVLVLFAIFMVLWHEVETPRQSRVAIVSGFVLSAWAVTVAVLAHRGFFRLPDTQSAPPIGIYLAAVLLGLLIALTFSGTLRSLLTNQRNLIWLNVWRIVGVVFLILMADGQMPALWAVPAGIGDIIVGVCAPWVARGLDAPNGRRRAIIFNLFGLADLIVAVGLGITTSPGPLHFFHTTATSEMATSFPLALVPTFLVPLAFTLHVVSLWQLFGLGWAPPHASLHTRAAT